MGEDASPEPASPGPKRLAKHQSVPDPTRGPAASVDKLTFEVPKLHSQRPIDIEYFKQIHDVIGDHVARITIANRYIKSEVTQLKSDINQNASVALDNDARLKEGLARVEAQVIANGAATVELRGDVQAAVHGLAQHPSLATGTGAAAPDNSELQIMRSKLEELGRRNEQVVKTVVGCSNEVLQRAEALVGSLRIDEVHRHLSNLDSTLSHTAALLSSRADESDQRIAGF